VSVRVVDGGLSTALEEAGHRLDGELWAARLLVDDPDAIVAAHLAYLRAGARMLVTSSYQASVEGFVAAGIAPGEAVVLLQRTTALAVAARRQFAEEDPAGAADALIAASVGPYGATLADGSEFRPVAIDDGDLVRFHAPRLRLLVETEPDLLAIETIASAREARVILTALDGLPAIPAWVTFTCRDAGTTWGGDPIEEAVAAVVGNPSVVAVGVNCTAPADVAPLLARIGQVTDLPLVAYPNGGRRWNATEKAWDGPAHGFSPAEVATWVELGARYVGGCCGTGPETIAMVTARGLPPAGPHETRGRADRGSRP
jgi:homocysteine S-methyltransferase